MFENIPDKTTLIMFDKDVMKTINHAINSENDKMKQLTNENSLIVLTTTMPIDISITTHDAINNATHAKTPAVAPADNDVSGIHNATMISPCSKTPTETPAETTNAAPPMNTENETIVDKNFMP